MKRKKRTILEKLIEKKFGTDPLIDDPPESEKHKKNKPRKPKK